MIEVNRLTKLYGELKALRELSFQIPRGEITGFLGLNGAGKSTALKILAGFLLPTSGSVVIDGIDMLSDPERLRARIGFLPERPPLYGEMTVSAYLRWLGRLRGLSAARVDARLPEVLERTGLAPRADQVIDTLSLGYRKRLGIAQAIVHDPALVILDEPTDGLDPVQRVQMRGLVRGLRGAHTVLISSHNLPEVQETCDRILVLHEGRLLAQGTVDEILAQVQARGRAVMTVTVRGESEAVLARLRGAPFVGEAHLVRSGADGLCSVSVDLDGGAVEQVAPLLVGAGFGLRHLAVAENELETAFLAVTGGGGPTP